MQYVFQGSNYLSFANVSGWNVSNVALFDYMFMDNAFQSLDLSHWDTRSATSMRYMFYGLHELVRLDISGLDTVSHAVEVDYMFNGPPKLRFFRMGLKTTWIDYDGLGVWGYTWDAEDGSWSGKVNGSSRPPSVVK